MKPLQLLVKLLVFHGMWPAGPRRSWASSLRRLYPMFAMTIALYRLLVTHLLDVLHHLHDEMAVCQSTTLCMLCLMAVAKTGTLALQTARLRRLVRELQRIVGASYAHGDPRRLMAERAQRLADLVLKYLPLYYTLGGVVAAVALLPEALHFHRMQDRGWHIHDISSSPSYELTLFVYSVSIVTVVNGISVCDATLVAMGLHAVAQFDILQYNLTNIRPLALRKLNLTPPNPGGAGCLPPRHAAVSERPRVNPGRDVKPRDRRGGGKRYIPPENTGICIPKCMQGWWWCLGHKRGKGLKQVAVLRKTKTKMKVRRVFPSRRRGECVAVEELATELDSQVSRASELDREMKRQLVDCVRKHRALTRWTVNFQRVFNPTFCVQFISMGSGAAVLAMYFTVTESVMDPRGQIMIQMFVFGTLELLWFCWIGSRITQEGTEVRLALCDGDWLDASRSFKQHMMIVISRSNVPTVIKVARFLPLSMEIFIKVIQTTYNIYMCMFVVLTRSKHGK